MSSLLDLNLPLLGIPLYYALINYPHGYAVFLGTQGDLSEYDNLHKDGGHSDMLKKRLTPRELMDYDRAEACHRSTLEDMPLFIATIFAGILADQRRPGLPSIGTTQFVMVWLALRTIYTIVYMGMRPQESSYLRGAIYSITVGWALVLIVKAAYVLGG